MYNGKSVSAIIVAAGSGTRMGKDKMLLKLYGKSVLVRTVEAFANTDFFDEIVVVSSEKNLDAFSEELKEFSVNIIPGGKTRGESSLLGILATSGEFVMIHDGARPLITKEIIENTLSACIETGCAAAGVKSKDTIKTVTSDNIIASTVDRETAVLIQTPQAFKRELIKSAYERFGFEMTDDCALMEKMGTDIKIVDGSYENIKLTTAEDIVTAEGILRKRGIGGADMRIGTGFDTHRLVEGRPLIIGGVNIPYEKGLAGHSDADVLVHAVIDALFGAAALGDIGKHFPDTDERYKGADSLVLLEKATEEILETGYKIGNIDSTIIAQAPKMAPHIDLMRENLAKAMRIPVDAVSVKAKTNEHMGFTGRGEGVEARAIVLITK